MKDFFNLISKYYTAYTSIYTRFNLRSHPPFLIYYLLGKEILKVYRRLQLNANIILKKKKKLNANISSAKLSTEFEFKVYNMGACDISNILTKPV